ncbi:MAG: response regulator [Candidatus Omnitrophica bacterium]|nr:response regulator [Candidatus Omnitrophota bacterium]
MVPETNALVICKDPEASDFFNKLLVENGFKSRVSSDTGDELLAFLKDNKPDLVLLNTDMSQEEGFRALKIIRSVDQLLPVVVLANEEERSIADKYLEIGATAYIIKSAAQSDIVKYLRREVDKSKGEISDKADIFIVDDDAEIISMVKDFLSKSGYACTAFEDSKKLIPAIKSSSPRLILLDIVMPDIDGIQLLEMIKEADENIKVVMMSGVADNETCISAVKKGASGYITKPFSLQQIKVAVATALLR